MADGTHFERVRLMLIKGLVQSNYITALFKNDPFEQNVLTRLQYKKAKLLPCMPTSAASRSWRPSWG